MELIRGACVCNRRWLIHRRYLRHFGPPAAKRFSGAVPSSHKFGHEKGSDGIRYGGHPKRLLRGDYCPLLEAPRPVVGGNCHRSDIVPPEANTTLVYPAWWPVKERIASLPDANSPDRHCMHRYCIRPLLRKPRRAKDGFTQSTVEHPHFVGRTSQKPFSIESCRRHELSVLLGFGESRSKVVRKEIVPPKHGIPVVDAAASGDASVNKLVVEVPGIVEHCQGNLLQIGHALRAQPTAFRFGKARQ